MFSETLNTALQPAVLRAGSDDWVQEQETEEILS